MADQNDFVLSVEQRKATMLLKLMEKGMEIRVDQKNWLRERGYLDTHESKTYSKVELPSELRLKPELPDMTIAEALGNDTITEENLLRLLTNFDPVEKLVDGELEENASVIEKRKVNLYGVSGIRKADWNFEGNGRLDYSPEFWRWITAINEDFRSVMPDNPNRVIYEPFELYRKQAAEMIGEPILFNAAAPIEEQEHLIRIERRRMLTNSLYGLNRHLELKEGELGGGALKYNAWYVQQITLFLFDLYISLMFGKPRQVGLTTTLGGAGLFRTMMRNSYFTKFITEKGEKGYEIFEDKVKYALYGAPPHLVPTVSNESVDLLRFLFKPHKGAAIGPDSKFKVEVPTVSAINGGTPNLVLLDEIGFIHILGDILNQGRPTMFRYDAIQKALVLARQVVAWGTGGKMDKGGGAMEVEFKALMESWMDKDYTTGIIPVFFDTFCKPGVTEEFLEVQKKFYYAKGTESSKTDYHQTYPRNIDDMFLRSSKTMLPLGTINQHINKAKKVKSQWGYFEPIFDKNSPRDEASDVPFKMIGARFVPVDPDQDHSLKIVNIIHPPVDGWKNRYYKGTDPTFTTGKSKFASAIWDAHAHTISAIMNWKVSPGEDHKLLYNQSLLLGMYYAGTDIKELVEANVASNFVDYLTLHDMRQTLIRATRLPVHIRTKSTEIGVRKQGFNATYINGCLSELLSAYSHSIFSEEFYTQLKTYVKIITAAGNEVWTLENKKLYYDDVIDAVVYAYMARQCFPYDAPVNTGSAVKSYDELTRRSPRYKVVGGRVVTTGTGRRGRKAPQPRSQRNGSRDQGANIRYL